jgi:hypothetical protein
MRIFVLLLLLCICPHGCLSSGATLFIQTFAGTGTAGFNGDGGAATSAQLFASKGVSVMPNGQLLIADVENHRIRIVYTDGTIHTFAGTGVSGFSGDNGAATSAMLSEPTGIYYVQSGVLGGVVFISDMSNHRVRTVSAAGIITTFAGTGTAGYNGDGIAATTAQLNSPQGVAVDSTGNVYIADFFNNLVRIVKKADGRIYTVAGQPDVFGSTGDGGPVSTYLACPPCITHNNPGQVCQCVD